MKTRILLNCFVLVCMILNGLIAQAQYFVECLPSASQRGKTLKTAVKPVVDLNKYDVIDYDNLRYYVPKDLTPQKAETGNVTITFDLQYNPDELSFGLMSNLKIINENLDQCKTVSRPNEDNPLTASVQPGIYDFIVPFRNRNTGYNSHFVIKEQIEITNDTTITISSDEASNLIHIKNYAPDGSLFKMGLGYEDENGDWIHLEDGNTESYARDLNIVNKDYEYWLNFTILIGEPIDMPSPELQDLSHLFDMYVNDISERYALFQTHITFSLNNYENYFVNYYSINDVKAGSLENDVSQYVLTEENSYYTNFGKTNPGYGYMIGLITYLNNWEFNRFAISFNNFYDAEKTNDLYSVKGYVNLPYQDPQNDDLHTFIQLGFVDYNGKYTKGTPFRIIDGVKEYVNFGHPLTQDELPNGFYDCEIGTTGYNRPQLSAHPTFTYGSDQVQGIYNDNCPINAFMVKNYIKKKLVSELSSYYIGRYGELRWGDKPIEVQTLKYNGEIVEDIESWQSNTIGVYDRTYTNTNVVVDGLPGKNETVIHYDLSQDDNMPPSIEMLLFKKNDGIIIDRFAAPEDGTIEFTAGDFNYVPNWERFFYYFDCQPVEVTVEYAPYGTENWNELAVEEMPELFQMPGWGYFYRGSLAGVTGQAEKGWFDLKIRLVDEAGNWQEQVVSPAFRIDNLAYSSVANIGDGNAHEVVRYSIDGKRVDASHHGVTIIRMSDGTAKKVLVK